MNTKISKEIFILRLFYAHNVSIEFTFLINKRHNLQIKRGGKGRGIVILPMLWWGVNHKKLGNTYLGDDKTIFFIIINLNYSDF